MTVTLYNLGVEKGEGEGECGGGLPRYFDGGVCG